MKPAFSTVACPDWTLEEVAAAARKWGYLGVELRTFGYGSTHMACDPSLSAASKVRSIFGAAGVTITSLASSVRFDEPITPPLIGRTFLFDQESSVRRGKALIDMAVQLECEYVRVFGFEIVNNDSLNTTVARIADRLSKVVDYARNSGVSVLLENGGSFATAAGMSQILDVIDHPLLNASYSLPVARAAGELPLHGVNVLGEKLRMVKIKDFTDGVPCELGAGELGAKESFEAVRGSGFKGWAVYEHDRIWFPELGNPSSLLESGAKTMFSWLGGKSAPARPHGAAR